MHIAMYKRYKGVERVNCIPQHQMIQIIVSRHGI